MVTKVRHHVGEVLRVIAGVHEPTESFLRALGPAGLAVDPVGNAVGGVFPVMGAELDWADGQTEPVGSERR
jgi:hypothetical protein